jgi:hypothetical protein
MIHKQTGPKTTAVCTLKGYSKALKYEYIVKTAALDTLKRYSIISLALYLEWYSAYSIVGSARAPLAKRRKKNL